MQQATCTKLEGLGETTGSLLAVKELVCLALERNGPKNNDVPVVSSEWLSYTLGVSETTIVSA